MYASWSFSPCLYSFLLLSSYFSVALSVHNDKQSLLAFKTLISSDPHDSMANWHLDVPLCNWTGITCSRRHMERVVALNLTSMDLQGPVSSSLANLSFLHSINLSSNAFHGDITPQIGRLFRLTELDMSYNQLEGSIPNQLGNCSNLATLYLHDNILLRGNIPTELGSLSRLLFLQLQGSHLTGTIPASLGNLSKLIYVDISNNSLSGLIPPQLGLLSRLQVFYLNNNELSGIIPASLSNISTLTDLDISQNSLNGRIPHELGLLTNLRGLYLAENHLSGTIPTSFSNISTLIVIEIYGNSLTGIIPQELGLLTNLQGLNLGQNQLSGTIPTSLSNISTLTFLELYINNLKGPIPHHFGVKLLKLKILDFFENNLSGNIPNSIGNCSKLIHLSLEFNMLSESVPIELGKLSLVEKIFLNNNLLQSGSTTTIPFLVALTNCSHLQHLDLADNELGGVLPDTIGKLSTNLSYLSLANNKIEGKIPPQIDNLSSLTFLNLNGNLLNGNIPSLQSLQKLERLYLGNNILEGSIPREFGQLKHLGLLDINRNMLAGKIPDSLCQFRLENLYLQHNYLSSRIPTNLGDCTNLLLLDLSHNRLTGSIPQEIVELHNLQFYLNLSWNLLQGPLPKEIGKLEMVQAIDISANQLNGVIPPTLGSCIGLQSLNLSGNSFQGSIPNSLGNLQNLMDMDLSSNSLSGTIPEVLEKLKMLHYLNLSFNKFTGEVSKGFFTNQNITISLIGNPGLCGPKVFLLPACPTPRSQSATMRKVLFLIILPIVGVIASILCCLLLLFFWKGNFHMKNFDFSQPIFQKSEHPRISYQELSIATNGFIEANLLGRGSFGSVYKGVLNGGTIVAVKVFNLQNNQGEKSFKAECNILQKVRHRNLVRIITSCSNLHFKGLVFEFMSNGSLENHLYPHRDDNNDVGVVCELSLKRRLDIAIDVAHAIEYLHHDSSLQVVHCDIKPSNVLLDEDMTSHVTDFGIAKLISATSPNSLTTSPNSLTSTLVLKGSMGYIAPEYGLGDGISTQGDVYSYGILLLEMLTRKRPTNDMFVGNLNLHKWVNMAYPNRVEGIIDESLLRELNEEKSEENNAFKCLLSLLSVGLICSYDSPQNRPTMRDVATLLDNIKEDLVGNTATLIKLRPSISTLVGNTSAPINDAAP